MMLQGLNLANLKATKRLVISQFCLTSCFHCILFRVGVPGHGGEYQVQEGFGWTNGVALYLLKKYGQRLAIKSC
jgi:hypothetical protein